MTGVMQRCGPACGTCRGWTADLTSAGLGGAAPYWHSYRYDPTGNRVSEAQHATADPATTDVTRAYTYAGHRLDTVTTTDCGGTRLDEYGYDPAGNTTSRVLAGEGEALGSFPCAVRTCLLKRWST